MMPVPREIIDNSEDNKLSSFLKEMLKEPPRVNFEIATAFFNVGAYALLREELASKEYLQKAKNAVAGKLEDIR